MHVDRPRRANVRQRFRSNVFLACSTDHSSQPCCFSQDFLRNGHRVLAFERKGTDVNVKLPPTRLELQAAPCLVDELGNRGRNSETSWKPHPWELEQRTIRDLSEHNHSRWSQKLNLLNEVWRRASVDHIIGRILMAIFPCDRAFHAMNEEETSGKQVFPRTGKGREDEKLAEVVIGVVRRTQRTGLRCYFCVEGGRDPDEEKLDALGRHIRLLPDVAGYASMMSARLTGPDRILNLLPGDRDNGHHERGLPLIRLTTIRLQRVIYRWMPTPSRGGSAEQLSTSRCILGRGSCLVKDAIIRSGRKFSLDTFAKRHFPRARGCRKFLSYGAPAPSKDPPAALLLKIMDQRIIVGPRGSQVGRKLGCRVASPSRRTTPMDMAAHDVIATPETIAEVDRLGEEIAELSAHLEAATAQLLDLIREFDARGGWNHGFRSCAHWLSWRVGVDLGAARERVRVARALGSLPQLADALARGELSYAKVRALTRIATPEDEERLLAIGRAGTACHVERIVRGWRRVDALAEARESAHLHKSRAVHVYQDEDGMVVIRGRLTPEAGAVLMQALAAARETLYQRSRGADPVNDVPAVTPSMGQQQADALALLAETALHHELDPGAPGERYQVVVHVDAAALADPEAPGQSVLEGGTHVPAETSRRLACDARRVVMRHDAGGRIVEVGARTRTIPPAIRRALHHRDNGCRFPGCGVSFGQGHHIRHWAQGGPTTLSNLAMLCRRHHRAVHEEGYQVERQSDGELKFRRPDGRVLPDVPPPRTVPDNPVHALRRRNAGAGLDLGAHTLRPGWLGEPLDVGYAISVLHPLAIQPMAAGE
jgi:uncharacterized protein DUF222/HNH endonuclease